MKLQTLPEWLEWLEMQHHKEIDLGLDRVKQVAERLNLLKPAARVITVAGTNGKGSFVAALATILQQHGYNVACYTSPHIIRFNERMVIDGEEADDESIVDSFCDVHAAMDNISLTYFEFTTLAALQLFAQQDLDVIILEVGLGGRLDAVNIIDADIAVITSIGIDHVEYLGNDREVISTEKCGIIKPDSIMVSAEENPTDVLAGWIERQQGIAIGQDFFVEQDNGFWSLRSATGQYICQNIPENGLSVTSQAAAIMVAGDIMGLQLDDSKLKGMLGRLSLPGRFQQFELSGIHVVLDVAHNLQAVELLLNRLKQQFSQCRSIYTVFNMLDDKDALQIVKMMEPLIDTWSIGEIKHPRAFKTNALYEILKQEIHGKIIVGKSFIEAFDKVTGLAVPGDCIIVFGSFYGIAELLPELQAKMNNDNNSKHHKHI